METASVRKRAYNLFCSMLVYGLLCAFLGYLLLIKADHTPNLDISFREIFVNNVTVFFRTVLFSILSFGFYGLFFIGKEMFFLGVFLRSVAEAESFSYAVSFISFHAIFEIPAIVLSGTIGILFWCIVWNDIKKKRATWGSWGFFAILLMILFLLTVTAAVVETKITTLFLRNFILGVGK